MLEQWLSSLGQYSSTLWVLAAIGVFLTGVSKSGFAGSTGVVAVPMMSIVMDPKLAAALLLPLLLFMDALNVKAYWQGYRKDVFKSLALGALIGIFIGSLLFKWINPTALKLCIGLLSVLFALNQLLKPFKKESNTGLPKWAPHCFGCISGFTSFVAHAGGAPLTIYFLKAQLNKDAILATSAVVIGFMNLIKLPTYALVGALNLEVGLFSVVLLPLAWLGIRVGLWLKEHISEQLFTQIMTYSLLILGGYLVYASL